MKRKEIKVILFIISILLFLFSIYQMQSTFSLIESKLSMTSKVDLAKWNIHINNTKVTEGYDTEFKMNQFVVSDNVNVLKGNIAPGMTAVSMIKIIPKELDVAVRYDISLDTSEIKEDNIKISIDENLTETRKLIKTGENKYTGIILLEDLVEGFEDIIKIKATWENKEANNEIDTEIGTNLKDIISIPVKVHFVQYLGEEIIKMQ